LERIVFLDRASIRAAFRPPSFAHEWVDYPTTAPAEIVTRLASATIAITNKIPLRAPDLARLPQLRAVAVAATGVDCVDLNYCRERGIAVSNVRHYSRRSVPEHVLMLLLNLRRNFVRYQEDVGRGAWQQAPAFCLLEHPIHDLHGATLGIVGHGVLGQAVEKLALAFGMRVLIAEHKGATAAREGRVTFDELLRESDAVTLHCPLTPETRGLIGEAELERMKPGAVLINCGRGGLVDEAALVAALKAGRIAGAGVDVLTAETPRSGNPLLDERLSNLIVTPHNAWASDEAMQILADQLVDNLEAFVAGRPQNLVV
jgi:glycerate dehydrogenase